MNKLIDEEQEIIKIVENPITHGLALVMMVFAFFGMIVTAWQVMENPDGLCASCCRLSVRMSGCLLKALCLPCNVFCGKYAGYQGTDPTNRAKFLTPEDYTNDLTLQNEEGSFS